MSFDLETGAFAAAPSADLLTPATPLVSNPIISSPALPVYTNIVLPGDFPDPTIAKIGDTYWASATSAEWGPVFPLFKSTNLVDWELVSYVFPDKLPGWADANFWAPEISYEDGKTYICYTARRKDGPLCVAMASADDPAGPYLDHGPLIGQKLGSIDGFPVRDEHGDLYLIWKEDGNCKKKPTPIWAQPLNETRTALTGERVELFRNDAPWEGCLVEGSAIVHHGEYFYMFYAGNGCCGKCCNYATGVARARQLLGPWEKCPQNPILDKNKTWKCPGHGTAISHEGRWFLLHHAYYTDSHQFVGRQGMFSEFTWNAEGWPEFEGRSPQAAPLTNVSRLNVNDEFEGNTLSGQWQWAIGQMPGFAVGDRQLLLTANASRLGAMLAQRTYTAHYSATTKVDYGALAAGTLAGLAVIGDPYNAIGLMAGDGLLQLWQVRAGKRRRITEVYLPAGKMVHLRLDVQRGSQLRFAWSTDGMIWQPVLEKGSSVNGTFLPPWDRGLRVGLLAQGASTEAVAFDNFTLTNHG